MISLIVAYSKNNRVIGKDNKIPWHIKEDFIHFKNYTLNKTIIMGEQTFISIGKPLPKRKTIVATKTDFTYDHEDVSITHDLFSTLKEYKNKDEELVVCGGATIYKLALPYVDKLIISEVKKEYEGDTFFPSIEEDFVLEEKEDREEFVIKIYKRCR
ncbi:MAG: dihydrofolate reductase [Erysipelotrichaceae bacterium]|nr:dihydrofolate reductase [Erysipelotrichaceae bacterium]